MNLYGVEVSLVRPLQASVVWGTLERLGETELLPLRLDAFDADNEELGLLQ